MKYVVSLAQAKPYFDLLDEYFGMSYPGLADLLIQIELNPGEDHTLRLTEHVSGKQLQDEFEAACFNTPNEGFDYVPFLWLLCNLYFGQEYYDLLEEMDCTQAATEDKAYDTVREVAMECVVLLEQYKRVRNEIAVQRSNYEKEWNKKAVELWRKRREEKRKKCEKEWGEDFVNGPDWKYVQEEISKEADAFIEKEKRKALIKEDAWKQFDTADVDNERVTITIGKNKVKIENAGWIIADLLQYHLFPHFIPEIKTAKQVTEIRAKGIKRGKKPQDNRITAVIFGISQLFIDKGLVQNKTQDNLCKFIRRIIELMEITNNKGTIPTTREIEDLIESLPSAKHNPKFYSATYKPVSREELHLRNPDPTSELSWLMHPSND